MFPAHEPEGWDWNDHGSRQSGYNGATWLGEHTTPGLTPVLLACVLIFMLATSFSLMTAW